MNNPELQVADYVFVTAMAVELSVKILAEGLIFTPNALLRDISGILDVLIFSVNLVWVSWMPESVEPGSLAQMFMILRCFRPLRNKSGR
jgi:sodium leak channel non-selective protein